MLTISVKNFGPIAEGSVDLKPLTIFVGPSNTGKSYMATAIHGVSKALPSVGPVAWAQGRHDWLAMRAFVSHAHSVGERNLTNLIESIGRWTHRFSLGERQSHELLVSDLPSDVFSWLETATLERLSIFQQGVIEQLRQIHGDLTELMNKSSETGDSYLAIHRDVPSLHLEITLSGILGAHPEFDISRAVVPSNALDLQLTLEGLSVDESTRSRVSSALLNSTLESAFSGLLPRSYFLPAARSGIAQGHKVLSAAVVQQSSLVGLQEMHIPTLTGITTEFLSHLINLEKRVDNSQDNHNLRKAINFIESDVLKGEIDLDDSSGLPYSEIVYLSGGAKQGEQKFTLNQTSSMVSELAPLILFLKYLIRPGDLLILEEPESHLHPAAQRQLARGVVRLVNAGVKVLITTHSDIFISQINNLLGLRQASPELIETGGFEPADFLEPEQVGAYLFRYSQELRGCETVELEIDPDTGIDEDEFANVFEAMYDESIALQRDRN